MHSIPTRSTLALLAILITTLPAFASKERAVQPLPLVTVAGVVRDATTNAPVQQAEVINGNRSTMTNAEGAFQIAVPSGRPTTLLIRRTGYEPSTVSVPATPPLAGGGGGSPAVGTITVTLRGKPTVSVREVSGRTYELDFETVQFAYAIPFSGYARSDKANLCVGNGTKFEPSKDEVAKIIGPATPATNTACCNIGPVLSATLETKSGQRQTVFFNDNCFGSEVDFIGRDHNTANFVYLNFTNIAEITFP